MEYNPKQPKAQTDLAAPGDYLAYAVKASGGATRAGAERWNIFYFLLDLIKAEDQHEQEARDSIGLTFSDKLIGSKSQDWRWDNFLPVMFPEIKKAGVATNMVAPQCIGKAIVIRLEVINGNPEYGEPEKINRAKRYFAFEGEMAQYKDKIVEVRKRFKMADVEEDAPPADEEPATGSEPFDDQF